MHITMVHVWVKPEHIQEFIDATRDNHEASIEEEGNLRFDVMQLPEDPCQFVLYEAYDSKADAMAHKNTRHYQQWRDKVADWMAKPRQGVVYDGLFPEVYEVI